MKVNHSGWSEKYGSFSYDIFIDEKKTDYEIHYKNGDVFKQENEFSFVTADWNCDDDVYTQFGANFTYYNSNGEKNGRGFFTPQDMVSELVDGLFGDHYPNDNYVVSIPGINLPTPDKRPSLHEQMARTERQKMYQDIERNRKMNALGIRGPGEPWAR